MRRPRLSTVAKAPHLIRFRLTLWYTGLAAVVLAAFVGGVFYAFHAYQFDTYDQQMKAALQSTFKHQVRFNFDPGCVSSYGAAATSHNDQAASCSPLKVLNPNALQQGDWQMQFMFDGKPLPAPDGSKPKGTSPNSPLAKPPAKQAQTKAAAQGSSSSIANTCGKYRCVTLKLNYYDEPVIGQIAGPMGDVQRQVDDLKLILVYVAGVLLVISAIGGWLLAGRALKPIDDLTRRAQQISASDLSQRLNLDQEDELGRLAATFDDLIARLQEAFERQKRFTSDASHELRTPLTVMQADIGLALARPRSAEDYRETLISMDEEVDRLSTIVGTLLTLTRIDVDPAGMQHQPVALQEVVETLVRRVGVVAAERDITVAAERLDAVTITGDATRLRQLFTNLLDNAVTYTPDGGRVSVWLESTREGARVQVSDTGIGIAPEHLPRIFERFYRADQAREQNTHGTGLGLAIARSVAQAHHGDIGVESTPGKGTTFTVTLPVHTRRRVHKVPLLHHVLPGGAVAR